MSTFLAEEMVNISPSIKDEDYLLWKEEDSVTSPLAAFLSL